MLRLKLKKQITTSLFLLFFVSFVQGQSIIYEDSIAIVKSIDQVITIFEAGDHKEFNKIATREIYCIICEGTIHSELDPYVIQKEEFFNKYLDSIRNYESWQRAIKSENLILIQENNSRSDITAYLTTWKKNEYAEGHEGEQLGLYFKKIDGVFKFAGIEVIP